MNKIVRTFIIILFCICSVFCICYVPIKGNYKINYEKDSIMYITYSSILPFVTKDTIAKCPVIVYGKVIENTKVNTETGITYFTVTEVKGHRYVYHTKNAYEYILKNEVDSQFRCLEKFWPDHYIETLDN